MSRYLHNEGIEPCPFLPEVKVVIRPSDLTLIKKGSDRPSYYYAALECAQSMWLCGFPAQALLQLNHALGENLSEETSVLHKYPLPYRAKQWIFQNRSTDSFLGNPVRHYQHLASRMSGKNSQLRSLRAWACFHLAEQALPNEEFPRDEEQIQKENLTIPQWNNLIESLLQLGKENEVQLLQRLVK